MAQSLETFGVPAKRSRFIIAIISTPLLIGVTIVGFMQTNLFGGWYLTGPDRNAIVRHIEASKRLQEACASDYKSIEKRDLPQGMQYEMFEPEVAAHLKVVVDGFLADNALQNELKQEFGVNFTEISVVVIPSWAIDGPADSIDTMNAGITAAGFKQYKEARKSDYVDGYTIRERPGSPRFTIDGRPRLVLNSSAFYPEDTLQLTLFHELLHCLNIEASKAPRYCFAQDDLRYLKKYRDEVSKHGWITRRQNHIWEFAVFLPLGFVLAEFMYAIGYLRSRRRRRRSR